MVKKKKNIKFVFYEVIMPQVSRLKFEQILQKTGQLNLEARNLIVEGDIIRLDTLEEGDFGLFEGEMIQLNLDYIGSKAKLNEHPSRIPFEDDEGISNETAFLYDPKYEILVLQSSRPGVSPSKIESYIKKYGSIDGLIEINPLIRPEAFKRASEMDLISKFEIKIAGLESMQSFFDNEYSDKELGRLMERFKSPWIDVIFSLEGARVLIWKNKKYSHLQKDCLIFGRKTKKTLKK